MKLVQWPSEYYCEVCEVTRTKYAILCMTEKEMFICPSCLSELRNILNAALIVDDIVSIDHYSKPPKDRPQIP